mmetsp:Transcript_2571/g.5986  ORF Transcript_2571/g.5986 Transcript_2571/m.5986 type:complete len:296 (-) Transcript_2571:409-1296(-)
MLANLLPERILQNLVHVGRSVLRLREQARRDHVGSAFANAGFQQVGKDRLHVRYVPFGGLQQRNDVVGRTVVGVGVEFDQGLAHQALVANLAKAPDIDGRFRNNLLDKGHRGPVGIVERTLSFVLRQELERLGGERVSEPGGIKGFSNGLHVQPLREFPHRVLELSAGLEADVAVHDTGRMQVADDLCDQSQNAAHFRRVLEPLVPGVLVATVFGHAVHDLVQRHAGALDGNASLLLLLLLLLLALLRGFGNGSAVLLRVLDVDVDFFDEIVLQFHLEHGVTPVFKIKLVLVALQ